MGRAFWISTAIAVVAVISQHNPALAYTPTVTANGTAVRWQGAVKYNLAGNPGNQNGLSAESVRATIVRSLQRWKAASLGSAPFDYWQGSDPSVYEPNSEYNGQSSVYFASNANGRTNLTPNILGLTQVWYNTDTGEILEADIVLNDRDFNFTTDARDTSGYGTGQSGFSNGKPNVFIENVLTHEIGHSFGLSHSAGLQSTMLFMESPEQARLGCDETVAIRAMYPSLESMNFGAIEGAVVTGSGAPVFGAHVVAISRRRGTALASAVTDKSGRYQINALEPGTYFLMAEPFFGGSQALPSYYGGMAMEACPGHEVFGRTVLTTNFDSEPAAIAVGSGARVGAPVIQVKCNVSSGAAFASANGGLSSSTAPMIYDGIRDGNGFGMLDRLDSSYHYYKLNSLAGNVQINVMSYSLYSPIRTSLSLFDEDGQRVTVEIKDHVYRGESGYTNYDTAIIANGLPAGDYTLRVSASPMNASYYPAGPVSLDSVPFVLIMGSVNDSAPVLASGRAAIPNNARCRMDENFPAYQSPAGDPPRSFEGDDDGVGFCGTVNAGGGSSGNGTNPAAILGWFLPFLAMAAVSRLVRPLAPAHYAG